MSEYIFKPRCADDFELDERDRTNPVDWYGTLHGEIVRCRDCRFLKRWSWADGSYAYECAICDYNDMVEPNGFCAWASRKVVGE